MQKSSRARAIRMLLIFAAISALLWPAASEIGYYLASHSPDHGPASGVLIFVGIVVPILVVSMIFAGLALYVLSRSFRLLYGVVEILAGIGIVAYTFTTSLQQMMVHGALLPNIVQIAVALYFFAQGLEDTAASLQPGTRWREYWDRVFRPPARGRPVSQHTYVRLSGGSGILSRPPAFVIHASEKMTAPWTSTYWTDNRSSRRVS